MHPRAALFDPDEAQVPDLPVCDHYSGVEPRMRKSLELQAELGPVFDVTLDAEDGAPIGGEVEHAHLIAELATGTMNRHGRVGARVPPVDHPRFGDVVSVIVGRAASRLAYVMVPKVRGVDDLARAAQAIDAAGGAAVPLHALVETHGALREVQALAAHPRIESLSFGLMDFVSAHRGAIPRSAMDAEGQFEHPLVMRAKLEIAAACHAYGKVPSHCVVTEFQDLDALKSAAETASRRLGYLRMWSIHPAQIRPIVAAFAPRADELALALEIVEAAQAAHWAPIRHRHGGEDRLHDRASYRYFWQLIERAERTGWVGTTPPPAALRAAWFGGNAAARTRPAGDAPAG
jgi:citrate lyase subunit beta/citryl-CoA lyase